MGRFNRKGSEDARLPYFFRPQGNNSEPGTTQWVRHTYCSPAVAAPVLARTCAVMAPERKVKNSQVQRRTSQGSNSYQTRLSAWKVREDLNDSKSISKHRKNSVVEDFEHGDNQVEDALQIAVRYFEKGPIKTAQRKDKTLERHFKTVENVAWKNGLAPEGIDILLNVALSGRFGSAVNTRIFKCMIPATLISEDSVVKAVSWLCVGKCSGSTKVLFYRWLVAMFDFIDHKEQINLLYGFFFASLQDDALLPSQMGAVLNNSLLLHYINCVRDESVLLRLYHWLSQTLQEECIWYKVNNYEHGKEFTNFLDIVIRAECFLQCSVLQCLKELLQNWLLWLSMDIHLKSVTNSPLYRKNLTAAKENELVPKTKSEFSFSSKTYQEFNHYLTAMVGCLWTSKPFQKGLYIDAKALEKAAVAEYKNSLNLVHHPAFMSYTVSFLLQDLFN
ncbi:hypothetical protein CB1_001639002 [Camelus ferus]|nr:hypothetical protein CB1_001639002 [Camelus ferus]